MKTILAITAAVLAASPALAGGLRWGNIAGGKYCEARGQGYSQDRALRMAVLAGWDDDMVIGSVANDKATSDMIGYVKTVCPQYRWW
jgi:hypothetical protein